MGNLFNQPLSAGEDPVRTTAAANKLDKALGGTLRATLKALDFRGELALPLATTISSGDVANQAYHERRTRPYAFNDCNYPLAIVEPADADDVVAVVRGLRDVIPRLKAEGFPGMGVAGGRHSPQCMVDDTVVVDLEKLKNIVVDVERKLVTVEGGCKIREVDFALRGTGLGFVTGTNGDTGCTGLTLMGGMGYLARGCGMAADNVVRAVVILATGERIEVTDDNEHAPLMRALRGGGGNFGIVTSLTMRLHSVSGCVGGAVVHLAPTTNAAKTLMKSWQSFAIALPERTSTIFVLPASGPVCITLGVGFDNEKAKSYKDVDYMVKLATLKGGWMRVANDVRPRDYHSEMQPMLEAVQSRGNMLTGAFCIKELNDQMTDTIFHNLRDLAPTKKCMVIIFRLGGKVATGLPNVEHSLPYRRSNFWVLMEGVFNTPAEETAVRDWHLRFRDAVKNVDGFTETNHTWYASLSNEYTFRGHADIKDHLAKMKTAYDPSGVFGLTLRPLVVLDSNDAKPAQQS